MPAFGIETVLTRWQWAPVVTVLVVAAAGCYLWGAWRVGRRHPGRPWPWWRTTFFLGGLAVAVMATESGIGAYDDNLFWDHMLQHLLLLMVAPPLMIAGQPVTLLLHASRNPLHTWAKRAVRSWLARFLTWPPFVLAAYAAAVAGAHLTSLAQLIHTNPVVHDAEHAAFLLVGFLFFLPLIGNEPIRWRLSYLARLLVLAVTMPVDTFTGLILGYQGQAYALGVAGTRPPGSPSPVEDVHWAGSVMWVGGDAIMFLFMMLVVWQWSRDDRTGSLGRGWLEAARKSQFENLVTNRTGTPAATPARRQDHGGIDDDEHLAAYNAYLARLHGPGPSGGPPS